MNVLRFVTATALAATLLVASPSESGFKGMPQRGGMGGGGGRPQARPQAMPQARPQARPQSMPQMRPQSRPQSRPSLPNLGGGGQTARPPMARPSISRPAVTRPNVNTPNFNRPNVNPPNLSRPTQRPAVNVPGVANPSARPGGGFRPNLPQTLPGGLPPNFPNVNLPSTRPGQLPGSRPATRPSLPGLADNLPSTRPGLTKPGSTLPSRPNRPGARPSPGDLSDFLDLDRPVTLPGNIGTRPGRPERPVTLPGNVGNRPGKPDRPVTLPGNIANRPNKPDRPVTLPGNIANRPNRPGQGWTGGNRPGVGDRPWWDRPGGGYGSIHNRPGWVNVGPGTIDRIHGRWATTLPGLTNWQVSHSNRVAWWGAWGTGVRGHWSHYHHCHNWFGNDWWLAHRHARCGWHYCYAFNNYSWNYWWRRPSYDNCVAWFYWTQQLPVWRQGVYYDYGQGGNVVYQDSSVYLGDERIASAAQFAQTAAALATVAPPESEEVAAAAEWLPLGTFAVSTGKDDVDPTRAIQLAVNKEGVVAGTLYNSATDEAQSVQGQVDRETQRVAFRIGDSEEVVAETGLYNLTQDEAPVLVHFGTERVESYLFVRIEAPEGEADRQ